MNEINIYIGGQIRKYRKANGMTLQQLADVAVFLQDFPVIWLLYNVFRATN